MRMLALAVILAALAALVIAAVIIVARNLLG